MTHADLAREIERTEAKLAHLRSYAGGRALLKKLRKLKRKIEGEK